VVAVSLPIAKGITMVIALETNRSPIPPG
jgi:hypothetical protein